MAPAPSGKPVIRAQASSRSVWRRASADTTWRARIAGGRSGIGAERHERFFDERFQFDVLLAQGDQVDGGGEPVKRLTCSRDEIFAGLEGEELAEDGAVLIMLGELISILGAGDVQGPVEAGQYESGLLLSEAVAGIDRRDDRLGNRMPDRVELLGDGRDHGVVSPP